MIEDTLNRTGLGHIWLLDGSLHKTECIYIKDRLQLRLNDIFKQEWLVEIRSNRVFTNFAVLMKEFCEQFNYVWTSCKVLPNDTYTYVSDVWGSCSWLDHCISTEDGNGVIINAYVIYGSLQSDHIPIVFELDLQFAPDVDYRADNTARRIDWSVLCEDVIRKYGACTDLLLSNIVLPIEALLCKDGECTNENHKNSLCQYYDNVVEAIKLAGVNTINTQHMGGQNDFNRPGWTDFASDLYDTSRDVYFLWKDSGSLRQGELFDMKNRAKARFKGAMRFIRSHEDSLRKDSLAKKLLYKNDKEFWKKIKRMRSKVSLPNVIDGVTGSDSIYIISEDTSIFAPQRLPFYKALGVAACTVGKVRASTVFMCVCSTFRSSDFFTIRQKRIRRGGALPR